MRRSLLPVLLLFLMLSACHPRRTHQLYTIGVVTLGATDEPMKTQVVETCRNLLNDKVHPVKILWLKDSVAAMPAYYAPRNRYRAEILLRELNRVYHRYDDQVDALVLVTKRPVSTAVHGIYDYGICGLSYLGGHVSVVSAYHLDGPAFCQVLRHEWGHGTGLPHCEEPGCLMNDAKGKMAHVKGHSHFGPACYAYAATRYR